jgi:clan AA aspartic protease (TIGR02281 family)
VVGDLDLRVVNWSPRDGYVLLSLEPGTPVPVQPVRARSTGSLAEGEPLQVSMATEPVRVSGFQAGQLVLDRTLPGGAALLDRDGRAVGLTLGGALALPVNAAIPWLGHPGVQDLEDLRGLLREAHPTLALEDSTELLTPPRSPARTRQALELLDRAMAQVRDRDDLADLEELRKIASQILVQILAENDPPGALAEARLQLARYPSHPGLLADMLVLTLGYGDPVEALGLYDQLLGLSPEHAQQIAEQTSRSLSRRIRSLLRGQRYQEAIDQGAALVIRFTQRADLRMLYAQALWQAGRKQEALIEGMLASQLDPTHSSQVSSWEESMARDRDPGTVTLPYDPANNAITTRIFIGGQSLEVVIDTGATLTTIPSAFAQRLGLVKPDSPVVRVDTANGEVEGRQVQVPSLQLGTIRLRGVEVVVLDLPGSLQGKGLLGLNVLRPLNMRIDDENRVLILQRPRGRRRR